MIFFSFLKLLDYIFYILSICEFFYLVYFYMLCKFLTIKKFIIFIFVKLYLII